MSGIQHPDNPLAFFPSPSWTILTPEKLEELCQVIMRDEGNNQEDTE